MPIQRMMKGAGGLVIQVPGVGEGEGFHIFGDIVEPILSSGVQQAYCLVDRQGEDVFPDQMPVVQGRSLHLQVETGNPVLEIGMLGLIDGLNYRIRDIRLQEPDGVLTDVLCEAA